MHFEVIKFDFKEIGKKLYFDFVKKKECRLEGLDSFVICVYNPMLSKVQVLLFDLKRLGSHINQSIKKMTDNTHWKIRQCSKT